MERKRRFAQGNRQYPPLEALSLLANEEGAAAYLAGGAVRAGCWASHPKTSTSRSWAPPPLSPGGWPIRPAPV